MTAAQRRLAALVKGGVVENVLELEAPNSGNVDEFALRIRYAFARAEQRLAGGTFSRRKVTSLLLGEFVSATNLIEVSPAQREILAHHRRALDDLDNNQVCDTLRPKRSAHSPPKDATQRLIRAHLSLAVDALMRGDGKKGAPGVYAERLKKQDACAKVAADFLGAAGRRAERNDLAEKLKNWRDQFHADRGPDDEAARLYRDRLRILDDRNVVAGELARSQIQQARVVGKPR